MSVFYFFGISVYFFKGGTIGWFFDCFQIFSKFSKLHVGGYRALGDILSHFLNNFFVSQEFLKMSFLKQLELGERTCFSWFYYLMESILHSQWCLVVLSFFLLFPQLLSDLDWVWHCSSWCKCCCHTLDFVSQISSELLKGSDHFQLCWLLTWRLILPMWLDL